MDLQFKSLRLRNTRLISSRVSLTSCAADASLGLVGHVSGDCVAIKVPNRVDVLLHQAGSNTD